MKTIVFVGPTLSEADALSIHPEIEVRPPAACGDIVRALEDGAEVIGLVDGYFDHQLSVWHKEILWALSKGVRVYGSSSMGALRAAELHAFGMRGVGKVFEAYQAGLIEADDEVAIAHSTPEAGHFVVISEALVNVRATLDQAIRDGAIDAAAATHLLEVSRSIFYAQRTYAAIVSQALKEGLPPATAEAFRHFLGPRESRKVDQKRADALQLLEVLRAPSSQAEAPTFHFEYTEAWHEFLKTMQARKAPRGRVSAPPSESALAPGRSREPDAHREQGDVAPALWCAALERALARELIDRHPVDVNEKIIQEAADQFRRRHGLLSPEATQEWMSARGLNLETFSAEMRAEAVMERLVETARELARTELRRGLGEARNAESSIVMNRNRQTGAEGRIVS